MSQVSRQCILRGDFSSLLMVPESSLSDPDDADTRSYGYQDLVPFALGGEEKPPTFKNVVFESENPIMMLEYLGSIGFIERLYGDQGEASTLPALFQLILSTCGCDLGAFVKTIARLYGLRSELIFQHLESLGLSGQLQEQLNKITSSDTQLTDTVVGWIADVLALSNYKLKNPMTHLSPMGFLSGHGGSVHLSDASAVVGVDCPMCGQRFLIRVALLKRESELLNARAYRIPGLKYTFSLEGGVGFIVKNKCIIGRFVWGVPTCRCNLMEKVEVVLAGLPLPKSNMSEYGNVNTKEWLPVRVHGRINLS
ncbi:putative Heterokaryon incompatibility domain-containing protein [Seiridium unicorne]|uniref:Heterokaryon incompatibility domain-containing protein n=1 Tax=Seiridium unicorne TaxID=138068 RepID=A0ABR2V099_9PEZI